jgi:hypothetical protein
MPGVNEVWVSGRRVLAKEKNMTPCGKSGFFCIFPHQWQASLKFSVLPNLQVGFLAESCITAERRTLKKTVKTNRTV